MTLKAQGVALERHGSGEPLLLIHGTGGSRAVWRPVVDLLSQHHEVLLVDLPGHGESEPPHDGVPHTPIGYATILSGALEAIEVDAAHVAGNSAGGWTALEMAKLGRARSVVAIGPAGLWATHSPWSSVTKLWTQHKLGRVFAPLTAPAMRSRLGRTLLLGGTMAKPTRMPPEAATEMASTYARTSTFDEHLAATRRERFRDGRGIEVPVTIAWGERERLIPMKARRRDELPPHTRFVDLPGCGHLPMWDDPDLVARTILDGVVPVASGES
jgi:pimeloyl-ACP methyl ester carboxylesterase